MAIPIAFGEADRAESPTFHLIEGVLPPTCFDLTLGETAIELHGFVLEDGHVKLF
jgi:hypothetical protein